MKEQQTQAQSPPSLAERRRTLLAKFEEALVSGSVASELEGQYREAAAKLREQLGIVTPTALG